MRYRATPWASLWQAQWHALSMVQGQSVHCSWSPLTYWIAYFLHGVVDHDTLPPQMAVGLCRGSHVAQLFPKVLLGLQSTSTDVHGPLEAALDPALLPRIRPIDTSMGAHPAGAECPGFLPQATTPSRRLPSRGSAASWGRTPSCPALLLLGPQTARPRRAATGLAQVARGPAQVIFFFCFFPFSLYSLNLVIVKSTDVGCSPVLACMLTSCGTTVSTGQRQGWARHERRGGRLR